MPSSITHVLIADEVRALLPEEGERAVLSAPDYYYLGSQGPDILFFYRPWERGENLGRLLHNGQVQGWFHSMLKALQSRIGGEKDKCLAYALGYCTHYAADTVFHPFVYRYLGSRTRRLRHQQMESDWDVYFLAKLHGAFPLPYAYPFDMKKIARAGILAPFLKDCAVKVGKTLDEGAFHAGLINYGRYLKFFHGRFKGGMFSSVERIFGFCGVSVFYPRPLPDPRVIECENFEELADGYGKDVDGLFDCAIQRSAELTDAFLRAESELPTSLFRYNFEGDPIV